MACGGLVDATQCSTVVDVADSEFVQIKSDLENAGLVLTKLLKLNNNFLKDSFMSESNDMMKVKQKGWFAFFCLLMQIHS
jgi:hypothetical protein